MSLRIEVKIGGAQQFAEDLQRFRNALADRRPMHSKMAVAAGNYTRDYLKNNTSHASAQRVGGKPTGFRAKNAAKVQSDSDHEGAYVRIPRSTGLGRAFRDLVIRPGSGKTYLTIPAHQETYGKSVRDFPEGTFHFAMLHSITTSAVLMWSRDGGGHRKGEVAYWLKREISQKQDRTLLPSDAGYTEVGRRAAVAYITTPIYHPS